MSHTCLFVINGLGMGNSTRCHAVIEALVQAGWRVHVLTSGNGLAYFQDKACVASLSIARRVALSRSAAASDCCFCCWKSAA